LDGFDGIVGCEPSDKQCQLAIKCHLDGSPINPLHVLGGMGTATIYFHNKFSVFHEFSSRSGWHAKWRREKPPPISLTDYCSCAALPTPLGSLPSGVFWLPTFTLICFGLLRQLDLQHALVIVGAHLLRIDGIGQRERASKASILPLHATEVLFFLFLLYLALAMDGEPLRGFSVFCPAC
jgi:hypothetical protein